jgi:hypothetical protein
VGEFAFLTSFLHLVVWKHTLRTILKICSLLLPEYITQVLLVGEKRVFLTPQKSWSDCLGLAGKENSETLSVCGRDGLQ